MAIPTAIPPPPFTNRLGNLPEELLALLLFRHNWAENRQYLCLYRQVTHVYRSAELPYTASLLATSSMEPKLPCPSMSGSRIEKFRPCAPWHRILLDHHADDTDLIHHQRRGPICGTAGSSRITLVHHVQDLTMNRL